jgi:hypothetical protein
MHTVWASCYTQHTPPTGDNTLVLSLVESHPQLICILDCYRVELVQSCASHYATSVLCNVPAHNVHVAMRNDRSVDVFAHQSCSLLASTVTRCATSTR